MLATYNAISTHMIMMITERYRFCCFKQIQESTKGYSRWKVEQRHSKVATIGAQASPKKGNGTKCPEGYTFLAGMPHPCKCSMETTHNSVKVNVGIKVIKSVESLIGQEVTIGQGSECHLTFVRRRLHIVEYGKTLIIHVMLFSRGYHPWFIHETLYSRFAISSSVILT